MRTPTSPANLAKINKMYEVLQDTMLNLAGRWQDEGKYENIEDYRKVIEKSLPAGFSITKMTKRPFGFQFKIGTEAEYAIIVSGRKYEWKRVA